MSDWISVAKTSEFPPGTWRAVNIDNTSIAVFNLNGEYFAIENVCTHDGGTLTGGVISGDEIVCPRHGARFCIKTGAVTAPPAYEDVPAFPVKIENGIVKVRDNRFD